MTEIKSAITSFRSNRFNNFFLSGNHKEELVDFLPEGKNHRVQDEEMRRRQQQHSKLTNLTGEQVLGDLDFSLFKKRNALLHHHSTINTVRKSKSP